MYKRTETKKVKISDKYIGNSNNILIQSMCNTKTENAEETIKQILELEKAGCEIIRVTVPNVESANSIEQIKKNIHIPLVADIHFDYKLALMCIERGIDKIRINPGNIGDEDRVKEVALACKKKNIPIRIGVNSGSVNKNILNKYNNKITEDALVESAIEEIKMLEKYDFNDIVISIKSSNVITTIKSYEKLANEYNYPLHIGITEAGTLYQGNIKSSIGLGILIYEELGDTMRVSLSSDPVEEIKTAKHILKTLGLRKQGIEIVSCPTCGRTNIDIVSIAKEVEDQIDKLIKTNVIDENKSLKIAIMGCAVNGPGEAKDCDIGIAGGYKEGLLFKNGNIIRKIEEDKLVEELINEIINM